MRRKSCSVLMIPLSGRTPRQLLLSAWQMILCGLLCAGLAALLVFALISAGYLRGQVELRDKRGAETAGQLELEREQNLLLNQQIEALELEKAGVEARIAELRTEAELERETLSESFRLEIEALQERLRMLENEENELRNELGLDISGSDGAVGGQGAPIPVSLPAESSSLLSYIEGELSERAASLREISGALRQKKEADAYIPASYPLEGVRAINSGYGVRLNPITGVGYEFHEGIDLRSRTGDVILAAGSGTVRFAGADGAYGLIVVIDHENGYVSKYSHCSKLLASEGDSVLAGDAVGLVGSTGRSTGPHLDFRVELNGVYINPTEILEAYQ